MQYTNKIHGTNKLIRQITKRQFRNELQFFEMMDMDEIHATTIKWNHFHRLPFVPFEDFSENIIPAYIKDIYCIIIQEQ